VNIRIATIREDDREFYLITDVSVIREQDSWRLIVSDKYEYDVVDSYENMRFRYSRDEIILVDDYFEKYTTGDFVFLLQSVGIKDRPDFEELHRALPMLRAGEQTVPDTCLDILSDMNKDKWVSFGIIDKISRSGEIAESMYRIEKMELILDDLIERMSEVEDQAVTEDKRREYLRFQNEVKQLEEYYTGPEWKTDFELDEKGVFPSYLKRGVLSEDAVFDALNENGEIILKIKK